jgi:MerR family transcriptional regulator, light-induced transcriptional regulator
MQLRDAANALDVHYQTAYTWVRQGVLPARKTARGYEISDSDIRALAERRAIGTAPPPEVRVRDWTAQAARLHAAIRSGNETLARQQFGRLAHGASLTDLCAHLIAPALSRIGEQWAAGEVSIAVEHRATAICERLIASTSAPPQGRPRGTAVVATAPGERHALPSLMAAACLREDRWLVHHLANDLPAAEVAGLAQDSDASLVVLSSATATAARAAFRGAREISRVVPGVLVLIGRPGDSLVRLRELARMPR